ncbi:MAG: hypothetical protein HY000_09695, partial [Planctomycetes bacterium]|nr:hypothetical protein [Planctomycetota bacterium]
SYIVSAADAKAAKRTAEAAARAVFNTRIAAAQLTYDNDAAGAGVEWTAAIADADRAAYIARNTPQATVEQNIATVQAGEARTEQLQIAQVKLVGSIGSALVLWHQDIGDAAVTEAGSIGTARIEFVDMLVWAASNFAADRATAINGWTETVTDAETAHDNTVAGALVTWTNAQGAAEIAFADTGILPSVDRAEDIAAAEADYQIALAQEQVIQGSSFEALYSQANVASLTGLKDDYITFGGAMEAARMNQVKRQVTANAAAASDSAAAEANFVAMQAPAAAEFEQDVTAAIEAFNAGDVARAGEEQKDIAIANKARDVAHAGADKVYNVAVAQAERSYQVAMAETGGEAEGTRPLAKADANVVRVTTKADAQVAWVDKTGEAHTTFVKDDAEAREAMLALIATAEQTYDHDLVVADGVLSVWLAATQANLLDDQAEANGIYDTDVADAQGDFLVARYQQRAVDWDSINAQIQTPWTQYQADLADAEALWAGDFALAFSGYVSGITAAQAIYVSAVGDALGEQASAIDAADITYSDAVGGYDHSLAGVIAGADRTYVDTVEPVRESTANTIAAAERDYEVAKAQAARDKLADPEFDEEGALAAAAATRSSAIAGARISLGATIALAKLARATTTTLAYAGYGLNVGEAYLTWAQAYAQAKYDFIADEATANATRLISLADTEAAFTSLVAADYRDRLNSLATNHPSPWADHALALAEARATEAAAMATAEQARKVAEANAEKTRELADAAARKDLDNARATADNNRQAALDQAAIDEAMAQADAESDLADAGWLVDPNKLPSGLELPTGIDPSNPGDYWKFWPGEDSYYAERTTGLIGGDPNDDAGLLGVGGQAPAVSFNINNARILGEKLILPSFDDEYRRQLDVISSSINENGDVQTTYVDQATGRFRIEVTPVVSQGPPDAGPQQVTVDLSTVPSYVIDGLIGDSLARQLGTRTAYDIVVVPLPGPDGRVRSYIFQEGPPEDDGSLKGPRGSIYRLIAVQPTTLPDEVLAATYVEGTSEETFNTFVAGSLTFVLHFVPLGAAIDEFSQGNKVEGYISLAGDAALGLGWLSRTAKVLGQGRKAILLMRAAAVTQGAIGAVRSAQAVVLVFEGDYIGASGAAGEALLRILGARMSLIDATYVLPGTRLTKAEQATAFRLGRKLGIRLKESRHDGAEYIDDLGRSYDALGNPRASEFWNQSQFFKAIDDHLLKSNDFTVIDMTGFTRKQIAAVRAYVDSLPAAQRAKIIGVGF